MELNALSSFVCFIILVGSLRKIWLIGVLFLSALLNRQLALAFIYYSGGHVDSVQLLVANLSFAFYHFRRPALLGFGDPRSAVQTPAAQNGRSFPSITSCNATLPFRSMCAVVSLSMKNWLAPPP